MIRLHNKVRIFSFTLLLMLFTVAFAEDELTETQKQLKADVEHSLIAPCCWNMTVDQHDSPVARQVQAEINKLILEGKNKQEILAHFSSQPKYGERILATPSQDNLLGKLAYWLIPVAFVIGALAIYATVKRLSRKPEMTGPEDPTEPAEVKEPSASKQDTKKGDDFWQQKVENELNEFE